ncbi:hypothetical protein IC617_12510 [Neiella sp. HB171785]|uniref:Uncharacterized protein n=1 Tax=Neiella litorisoli TaxID=2771431 RepID=A0A8J6UGJ8_9GAMM|nr:hypothetical protein [Neiella litorisoli]MBD1390256.1 hypothetical protein [Neiella litorisoli]
MTGRDVTGDKQLLFLLVLLHTVLASVAYVVAASSALSAKRWALAGLLLGPVAMVMIQTHRRMNWQRAVGIGNTVVRF